MEENTSKVQIYLWNQKEAELISVSSDVTILDLINFAKGDPDNLVVMTDDNIAYQTPIIDFNKTLVDYNMWFPNEKSFIAKLYLFNKKDIHLYNKDRFDLYSNNK